MDRADSPRFQAAQERARQSLQEAFAAGELEMEELERRLERVEEATRQGDLAFALEGLRMPAVRGEVRAQSGRRVRPEHATKPIPVGNIHRLNAYFSRASLTGAFVMPARLYVRNFAGHVEIDLREAALPPWVTVDIRSFWGQTHILVPAGVRVTCQSYGMWARLPSLQPDIAGLDGPCVEISGRAIGGQIAVRQSAEESFAKRAQRSLRRLWPFR